MVGIFLLASCWVAAYFKIGSEYAVSVITLEQFELISLSVPFGYMAILIGALFMAYDSVKRLVTHLKNRSTTDAQKTRAR
jgi:hypothetical protein